jgi:carbonic anhydrase/acetyltransferase-like protein (isoleucine patch superfamily)
MGYRILSEAEISQLRTQGCNADDWNRIQVKDPFTIKRLRNVTFSGDITIGTFSKKMVSLGGIERECGIYNCYVHNCLIGDNVYLSNVATLANYDIADDVVIENVGTVQVTGATSFGNGIELDVMNEGGGRTLKIFDQLSAQMAYMIVFYRHNVKLIDRLNKMIDDYVATKTVNRGVIETSVRIANTTTITNVHIGAFAQIEGASCLEEGTLRSCREAPVTIGTGVFAKKFIVLSGSKIDQSAILDKCFVGQSVKVGKQYSAENSTFFCNSELFHGEGCSVFAGPYTVTHHKSTLLIAGFFSFYNAGSGTNQSNHMYKLGPVHQGILERGSKTGSFSYLSWPNRVGPFTVVLGKNYANFNTSDLPFSLIREHAGKSICVPGWNLFTVGTKRDGMKWPARDGRKDTNKLDLLHFQVLSPLVIGKMLRGFEKLHELSQNTPEGQEDLNFNGISIQKKVVKTSSEHYEMAIKIFIGDCLLRKLDNLGSKSTLKDIRLALSSNIDKELFQWVDINGLLATEPAIIDFVNQIVDGKIKDFKDFHIQLSKIHASYEQEEWKWCAKLIETRVQKPINNITIDVLKLLLDEWKTASLKFNEMILQDAMKEFSTETKLSYGIDGDEIVRDADFEAVRGMFEQNSFIKGVKEDSVQIEAKSKIAHEYLRGLI